MIVKVQVGNEFLVIINPFVYRANHHRVDIIGAKKRTRIELSTYETLSRTDTAINSEETPIDSRKRIIDISSTKHSSINGSQNTSFATLVNDHISITADLIKHGQMTRSYLRTNRK